MNRFTAPTARPTPPNRFQPQRRDMLRAMALSGAAAMTGITGITGLTACGGGGGNGVGLGGGTGTGTGTGTVSVTDRFVKVSSRPDVSLQVRDWQRTGPNAGTFGNGPTIVLLAGLGANARFFDRLAPALAADGRVVAISRRGYGQSDKPLPRVSATQYYDTETLTSDLKAVLDELGLLRVVLGGHSIAGNELTCFAGRYPERVRGLMYLDTTFDYTVDADAGGDDFPANGLLNTPTPTAGDNLSLQAAIAFNRRMSKDWWPPLEANLRDSLDLLADGSVRMNTPDDVETAMDTAAHKFKPDYTAVRAPALVVTALPSEPRDLFPWLDLPLDAKTQKDADDFVRLFRRVRAADSDKLVAALNTPHRLTLDNCCHTDFLMAREAEVLRAIRFMTWA